MIPQRQSAKRQHQQRMTEKLVMIQSCLVFTNYTDFGAKYRNAWI